VRVTQRRVRPGTLVTGASGERFAIVDVAGVGGFDLSLCVASVEDMVRRGAFRWVPGEDRVVWSPVLVSRG
jgi:hypothetical protein